MADFPGFIAGSYRTRSSVFDNQRTVNLYPEISKTGTSKAIAALYGTPGTKLWNTFAGGGIRGLFPWTKDILVIVSGQNVFGYDRRTQVSTLLGTIDSLTTLASIASNGIIMMMVTGPYGYIIDMNALTVTAISDPDFEGANRVGFLDGYFVFNKPGTGQFQISGQYSADIDALDFATAEGSPDPLISLLVDHRELWLFGEQSTEVYFNSGNPDFPLERIQGAFIEQGCAAANSPARMDNTVYWLSSSERGQGTVQRAQGYQPQRISTHAVEFAIGNYAKTVGISDAIGYTYEQEGHSFYVLTFPAANATWCYDAASDEWHERAWRDPISAKLNRHRSNCQASFDNMVLVGDWENGNVYSLDLDTYTDNGNILPAFRQSPYWGAGGVFQYFNKFEVVIEAGVGLTIGQGSDPKIILDWSDDGGKSWSNERWVSAGKIGETKARAIFRRLGRSRSRVFRVTITDPVKRVFVSADVDTVAGMA